ncbi:hypothetical protein QN219_13980 [Sinorhizobium sp. 7-81]|nr:hypothetical protein [Sinorhizobium sp. 8-89]
MARVVSGGPPVPKGVKLTDGEKAALFDPMLA